MSRAALSCVVIATAVLSSGCELDSYAHTSSHDEPNTAVQTRAGWPADEARRPEAPPVPLVRDGAAARALESLYKVGAELTPKFAGCTELPSEVSSFVSSVASLAKLLFVRIGAGATTHSLAVLAGSLRGGIDAVSQRTPGQTELRRLQQELTATVRDIAETFNVLADKLGGHDMLVVEHARARLRNAAGNYVTTVRTLVSECASG